MNECLQLDGNENNECLLYNNDLWDKWSSKAAIQNAVFRHSETLQRRVWISCVSEEWCSQKYSCSLLSIYAFSTGTDLLDEEWEIFPVQVPLTYCGQFYVAGI